MTDNINDDEDNVDVDPFSCFDDDDDDDDIVEPDDGNNVSTLTADTTAADADGATNNNQQRNSDCGILTFHAGTEQALLMYVEKQLQEKKKKLILNFDDDNNKLLLAKMVLDSIDEYCFHRHWMMHVGHEKGEIIKEFLQECCNSSSSKQQQQKAINVLELGTYCGYSSILIAKVLRDILGGSSRSLSSPKFIFYTIEVVEQNVNISREMIQYAGFEDVIHVLHFNPYKESLSTFLKREIHNFGPTTTDDDDDDNNATSKEQQQQHVDFLFIDHDKDLYLSDLQELESSGWIKKGCHVAADNVVFARIDNYRNYTSDLQRQGIVSTQLKDTWLEYSIISPNDNYIGSSDEKNEPFSKNEELRDGIELTIYLKDPSV